MTPNTHSICLTSLDPHRLKAWFPVADVNEVSARLGDWPALIDYLSFCNDLTRAEAVATLEELSLSRPPALSERSLRAA